MEESPEVITQQDDKGLTAPMDITVSVEADSVLATSTDQEELVSGEDQEATTQSLHPLQTNTEPAQGEDSVDLPETAIASPSQIQEATSAGQNGALTVLSETGDGNLPTSDCAEETVHGASRSDDTESDAACVSVDTGSERLGSEAIRSSELSEVSTQADKPSVEEVPVEVVAFADRLLETKESESSQEDSNFSSDVMECKEDTCTPALDDQPQSDCVDSVQEISEIGMDETTPNLPSASLVQGEVKDSEPADQVSREPTANQGITSAAVTDNEDTNASSQDFTNTTKDEVIQAKPNASLDAAADNSGRSTPNVEASKDATGRDSPSVRSGSPSQRPRRRVGRDSVVTEANELNLGIFPAENLFEYQWPEGADWYFIQEQISEFLQVKSFKRKYPDLERRVMDVNEKDFLRERGVVTEEQVTLGLTALRADEVYDLMLRDAPDKSAEYARVLHEKEKQNISNKHKQYEAPSVDSSKVKEYVKKAVRQAADYNSALMAERREERLYYFDMQTLTVQMPTSRMKKYDKEATKLGPYPVAVIPGQYQNYYRSYTSDELKYFPLNTAIYGPMAPCRQTDIAPLQTKDETDGLSDNDTSPSIENVDSSSDISNSGHDTPADIAQDTVELVSDVTAPNISLPSAQASCAYKPLAVQDVEPSVVIGLERPKDIPDAICGLCLKDSSINKMGVPEKMIHCSQCDNSGHPSCLDMTLSMVEVIQTYPWQCMECKTCFHCGDPTHEDKMMFCDMCDRGYHTFCVGLQDIPTGLWACESCQTSDVPAVLEPHVPTPPLPLTPPPAEPTLEASPSLPVAESTPANRKRGRRAATPLSTPRQSNSASKKGKPLTPTPKRVRKK